MKCIVTWCCGVEVWVINQSKIYVHCEGCKAKLVLFWIRAPHGSPLQTLCNATLLREHTHTHTHEQVTTSIKQRPSEPES
jgi:hypothetical protein